MIVVKSEDRPLRGYPDALEIATTAVGEIAYYLPHAKKVCSRSKRRSRSHHRDLRRRHHHHRYESRSRSRERRRGGSSTSKKKKKDPLVAALDDEDDEIYDDYEYSDEDVTADDEESDYDVEAATRFSRTSGQVVKCFSDKSPWQPVLNDRLTMFIAGVPGAGKSYLAKEMINLLPKNLPILLFTALEESDGNFDDLGKNRLFKIKMDPSVLESITLAKIREKAKEVSKANQAILLFDDIDKIKDPKVEKATFKIMNDALANGRGHKKHNGEEDIHVLCTSHSLNDYQKTKYTFENSNWVALFPGTTPKLQMERLFIDKLGLGKELCAKMIEMSKRGEMRSIIIHKVVPMYMIFNTRIMAL